MMAKPSSSSALELLERLRAEADAADAALQPTPEQERERMEVVRERAVEHGGNAKAGKVHGFVGCMRRNFERFVEKHGVAYEYDAEVGPTLEISQSALTIVLVAVRTATASMLRVKDLEAALQPHRPIHPRGLQEDVRSEAVLRQLDLGELRSHGPHAHTPLGELRSHGPHAHTCTHSTR